jgi:hypothetical protein
MRDPGITGGPISTMQCVGRGLVSVFDSNTSKAEQIVDNIIALKRSR